MVRGLSFGAEFWVRVLELEFWGQSFRVRVSGWSVLEQSFGSEFWVRVLESEFWVRVSGSEFWVREFWIRFLKSFKEQNWKLQFQ